MNSRGGPWWLAPVAAMVALAWYFGPDVWRRVIHPSATTDCVVSYPHAPKALSENWRPPEGRSSSKPRLVELKRRGRRYRALIYHACKTDYRVDFYKLNGRQFERVGAENELLGFSPPTLDSSDPPMLRARHLRSGGTFHFKIRENDVALVPDKGRWLPVPPR